MDKSSTNNLMNILKSTKPSEIGEFIEKSQSSESAFSSYMRTLFKEKEIKQSEIFNKIGISYGYGYKIISGEKHTNNRDLIIEICLSASFSLSETQHALKLYKMSELYPKIPRDAVFIIAFNQKITDLDEVNELLKTHGLETLYHLNAR